MRRRAGVLPIGVAVALTACSHSSPAANGAAGPTTAAARQELVVMGSSAGIGVGLSDPLRDTWPKVLWRSAFPISTVFVNASTRATTVDRAVVLELPLALDVHATTVAIWLGPTDAGACTTVATASDFESALTSLVKPLRDTGARVLVGNISDANPCGVAFNAAITNVAHARGAIVVDVAAALASTPSLGPDSALTVRQNRAVAAVFSAATAATGE